jgi:PEP-CTERM motif
MKLWLAGICAAGILVVVPGAMAGVFTTGQLSGSNWQALYAQGFSPSVTPTPDPGLSAGSTVLLQHFQFFKGGNPDSASNIRLVILNTLFPSNPNITALTTAASSVVGLSTNTLTSTAGIATGGPITFDFNSLPLVYGSNYAAVFVNVGADQGGGVFPLTPVLVSSLAANYVDDGTGTFHPIPNYGTETQFQYSTSNFINNGFFSSFSFAGDAVFQATLSTVPEPATLGVLAAGCAGLLWRRRR